MKSLIVLAALLACAISAEHRWVIPRLPLSVLLGGKFPVFDANDPKIVGGAEVTPNSLPFQISLQRRGILANSAYSHICGGSILDANTILNAAHCVSGTNIARLRVVAGEHSIANVSGLEQTVDVSSVVSHPSYNSGTYENDIALIKLTTSLNLSAREAKAINLPPSMFDPPAGTIVTVSGWGTTASNGQPSDTLRSVDVPVVDDTKCNELYKNGTTNVVTESMLCAGDASNGGIDSCQGDSGGPLFTKNEVDGSFVQHGIVSWGQGCALADYPGVYTQVSYFLDWIAANRG